jgi:hypothetical protein
MPAASSSSSNSSSSTSKSSVWQPSTGIAAPPSNHYSPANQQSFPCLTLPCGFSLAALRSLCSSATMCLFLGTLQLLSKIGSVLMFVLLPALSL